MTASDDFIPGGDDFDPGPNYPTAFGITFTPFVLGILIALAGLAAFIYVLLTLVLPAWEANGRLNQEVQDKRARLDEQNQVQQQIKKAEADLESARRQREDVLALFASEDSVNTLLLDINRQINSRSAADLAKLKQQRIAACPPWVKANLRDVERQVGDFVVKSQLRRFNPVTDPQNPTVVTQIIQDDSYGPQVKGKLKKQVTSVQMEADFEQTLLILQRMERLQPLLVFKDINVVLGESSGGQANTAGQPRLYDTRGGNVVFLENCQPDAKITTQFQMETLMPLSADERKTEASKPATPPK